MDDLRWRPRAWPQRPVVTGWQRDDGSGPPACGYRMSVMTGGPDRAGRLTLHYAAMEDQASIVEDRLACGDDPDASDRRGFTPLHFAAQQHALEAARILLDHGAQVDPVNAFGNSALSIAVLNSRGRGDMITLLRERGADPYLSNNYGYTPAGLARRISNYDVARYFTDLP